MKAYVTLTDVQNPTNPTLAGTGDRYLDLYDCELFAKGTVLAIKDNLTGVLYTTDFAWSSVAAVLAAAPGSGGFFVLT